MKNKFFLMSILVGFLLMLSFIFPGFVLAHLSEPGETPHVWSGKLLPESCPLFFMPVHDVWGTIYTNACIAAQDGIRVTWDGTHQEE